MSDFLWGICLLATQWKWRSECRISKSDACLQTRNGFQNVLKVMMVAMSNGSSTCHINDGLNVFLAIKSLASDCLNPNCSINLCIVSLAWKVIANMDMITLFGWHKGLHPQRSQMIVHPLCMDIRLPCHRTSPHRVYKAKWHQAWLNSKCLHASLFFHHTSIVIGQPSPMQPQETGEWVSHSLP